MKSLFDPTAHQEIKNRITALSKDSTPTWGKMNVGQMLTHCQFPLKVGLSDKPRRYKWNIVGFLFKKSLYNDKPWKKGLPTAKVAKITDERDFEQEQTTLLSMVDAFHEKRTQEEWQPHPMFGKFTPEQWGKLEYKHLDHHLTQFGV